MDPLSDVLSLLKLQSYRVGGFDAGGDWSIAFRPQDDVKFYAATSGACWLSVGGVPEAVRLQAGDCLLLPRGRPFRVASDLSLPPVELPPGAGGGLGDGGIVRINGGGRFSCVGGYFTLSGSDASVLLGLLPPAVLVHAEADKAVLRWCIERMRQELRDPQPGGSLVAQQLASMLLVQALRMHLAEGLKGGVGWLFALADRQLAAALTAMHEAPGRRWTLQLLARRAAMSRTSFTVKFKATVGVSPMDYLTRWRMMLAADRLATAGEPLAELAPSLGYESESAFSTAFKRVMGCSPRKYGLERKSERVPRHP